jgi:hypothetical protein
VTDTTDALARYDGRGAGVPSELVLLVGGLASGVAAKVADESGVSWLADLGTYPAVWVLVLAVVATLAPTIPRAALRASAFFVGMSVGYYAWASLVLDFGWSAQAYLWLGVALTVVPVAAAAVQWATRRRGVLPGAVMAGIAGLALGSGAVRQVWLFAIGLFPGHTLRPVQAAFDLLMMVVVVGVLPRHSATRWWGAVLVIPLAVVAGRLVDVFHGLL